MHAVVIPAYKPSSELVELVRTLSAGFSAIVIVDDGSGPEFQEIFSSAAALPGVQILRHAVHLGRGAALKAAFNHVLCSLPKVTGIVTADPDYHAEDIQRVAALLRNRSDCLVLGSRQSDERFGNAATRAIMHALLGRKLADMQTGLRGIPLSLLPRLMVLEPAGNDFELEMLIAANQASLTIVEEPIRTAFQPDLKPLISSAKVYRILLRFGSVSLITALIDNIVFILAQASGLSVLPSQVLGRTLAVAFNYWMVRSSVFASGQAHRSTLPKYLGLVVASGAASYAGIRILGAAGIPAIPAKLLVETFLFFVNFVVQRLFIFLPREAAIAETRRPAALLGPFAGLLFFALLGIEGYGLFTGNLFSQDIWFETGLRRFAVYTGAFIAVTVPLLLIAPWMFTGLFAAALLVLTMLAIGPQATLATVFFLLSACALGSRLLRAKEQSAENHLLATLLGTSVYIFLMTLLARLPIHYPAVWGALLAIPLLLDLQGVRTRLVFWGRSVRFAELRSIPQRAAFALLLFIMIAHWLVALQPESSADGLAMHLAIPSNIADNHRLTLEPSRFIWSVMPMGADWCYSIVYLLGGEYAAHLLVWSALAILCGLLYCLLRRVASSAAAMLMVAGFAATPLVQLVTGSLFVENFLAATVLGMVTALWRFSETGQRRFLYLAMTLGGTGMSIKIGAAAFLLLGLIFAIVEIARHWKALGPRPWAVCAVSFGIVLVTALPAYTVAYIKTGNPVFPFLNQKFPSPILDPTVVIQDHRFRQPVRWTTPYDLTFHTGKYYEGQDGSLGFLYLVIFPLAMLGLVAVRGRGVVATGLIGLCAAFFIMRSEPNARYIYSTLPLFLVPFAALLGWIAQYQRGLYRMMVAFLAAATLLDAWFLPSSSYYHKEFSLARPFSKAARERRLIEAAPIRDVIAHYNKIHGSSAVLFTHESSIAGAAGEIYMNHWHQVGTFQRLREAFTTSEMLQLLRNWNVGYLIARKPAQGERMEPKELAKLVAICTVPAYEQGDTYLARLDPACDAAELTPRRPAEPAVVAKPGFYDDFDPTIVFHGEWSHDESFEGPARHTVSYNDIPSAEVKFAFDGKALNWIYTKAPNRGIAEVSVDGGSKEMVDLYDPAVQWQTVKRFCCFTPGKHVVVIRITPETNSKSTGRFVDLDGFVVE